MTILAIFALLVFVVSLISNRLERTIITAPMIFTTAGILLYFTMSDQLAAPLSIKPILTVTELALAIVLFTDGTRIRVADLIGTAELPGRLLIIGMPLIILAGTAVAAVMFTELSIWEAAILGTILAPTDAGLGHAVISSERIPVRIRQALNVEAGLNDGLAIPFLMLFLAFARTDQMIVEQSWFLYLLQEVGLGILFGFIFGWVGGWLMGQAQKRAWMLPGLQQLALLGIAVLSWTIIDISPGNGFIGIFVAGLVTKVGYEGAGEKMVGFSNVWGQLFNMFVFALFGTLVGPVLGSLGFIAGMYALLSLTIVRMLPVGLSLIGSRLHRSSVLFMGWFGPRGLASIVLGLIYIKEQANLPGEGIITLAIMATVLVSIFAHGISAAPLIKSYSRRVDQRAPDAPELQDVVSMPVR